MFKSNLYFIPENTFASVTKAKPDAHVAVFVAHEDYLPEAKNMLQQILAAVKINIENDCILCTVSRDTKVHYYNAISGGNVSKILVFGLSTENLCLHIKTSLYTKISIDQRDWIFADSLGALLDEKAKGEKKKRVALWHGLKQLFEI